MPTVDGDQPHQAAFEPLMEALGHRFARPVLLVEALTHRSSGTSAGARFDYERLEFLGDRVLGLVVAEHLFRTYPGEAEGSLARRFTAFVRREFLARVAAALDLGSYLRLAEGEERSGGRDNPGIQADACEAVIGAVYIDGGHDAARAVILRHWLPLMQESAEPSRDSKSALQEWAQARGLPLPRYRMIEESGPPHEPAFVIEVSVQGEGAVQARASSKRRAEQMAAELLLESLGEGAEGEHGHGGNRKR